MVCELADLQHPLTSADFHHPLLGNTLRFEASPNLLVSPVIPTELRSSPGEWGGLHHAAFLLSRRFPTPEKGRMYIHHLPKVLSVSLLDEASILFAESLSLSATRGFRRSKRGLADVEMGWLVSQLRMERWREALLWSFIVGKMGGNDGLWGAYEREEVKRVLRGAGAQETGPNGEKTIMVNRPERETRYNAIESQSNGWAKPYGSLLTFCKSPSASLLEQIADVPSLV